MSRGYVGYWTIIDVDGYVGKDGKEHKNLRQLFGAKQRTLKRLKQKIEQRLGGNIAGAKMFVSRIDDPKSSRVGDDYEFVERVDLKTLVDAKGQPVVPYDYRKIFVPMTIEQARAVIQGSSISHEESQEPADDESVPF